MLTLQILELLKMLISTLFFISQYLVSCSLVGIGYQPV